MDSFVEHEISDSYGHRIGSLVFELRRALIKRYNDFETTEQFTKQLVKYRTFVDQKTGFTFIEKKENLNNNERTVFNRHFSFNEQEQQLLLETIDMMDKQMEEQERRKKEEEEEKIRKSWIGRIDV